MLNGFSISEEFQYHQERSALLLWHFTPQQIQRIEDQRIEQGVSFGLRARVTALSRWERQEPGSRQFDCRSEKPYQTAPGGSGHFPIQIFVSQSQWIRLLDEIDFKHILLHEFPLPDLQPQFSRSAEHLKAAWEHHHARKPHEALASCFKAFECLGYNLYGEQVQRSELFNRVMATAHPNKRKAVLDLCVALQNYYHFGRHEREQPIPLDTVDSEMALLSATALLGYFARLY